MRLSIFSGLFVIVFSLSQVQGQEKAGTTLFKALTSLVKSKKETSEELQEPVPWPQNSLSSPDNAITPTGQRLQPFGQPTFWGNQPAAPQQADDELAILPPLPDLRTPDQISKAERKRNFRNAKIAARRAEQEAAEEARKLEAIAAMEVPQGDPSTALIQVQSKRDSAQGYGSPERPTAVSGGSLKPFNSNSSYTEGCEVKFQWTDQQFVEKQPEAVENELGVLPPLPDLRTPDQVTKGERMRNLRILKFRSRQERNETLREQGLGF